MLSGCQGESGETTFDPGMGKPYIKRNLPPRTSIEECIVDPPRGNYLLDL